jgi:hypothetical protein
MTPGPRSKSKWLEVTVSSVFWSLGAVMWLMRRDALDDLVDLSAAHRNNKRRIAS